MDFWQWIFEQAKTASPVLTVLVIGASATGFKILWRQHVRDSNDIKSLGRAQARAMAAQARSNLKVARNLGELAGKIQSRR